MQAFSSHHHVYRILLLKSQQKYKEREQKEIRQVTKRSERKKNACFNFRWIDCCRMYFSHHHLIYRRQRKMIIISPDLEGNVDIHTNINADIDWAGNASAFVEQALMITSSYGLELMCYFQNNFEFKKC